MLHPTTGLHYIHVIHSGKAFEEVRLCYEVASKKVSWMSVGKLESWGPTSELWHDPTKFVIFWGKLPFIPPDRKAKVAFRYTESVGRPEVLIEDQRLEMEKFVRRSSEVDLVFCGTPAAYMVLRPYAKRLSVCPIGYEPTVMGIPDWDAKKHYDLAFYGSPVGRRAWILPALEEAFGERLLMIGDHGPDRKAKLEWSRAVLFVGHSKEPGFPGMRLWQVIATSAVLITEARDVWPAIPVRHYLEVPAADERKVGSFVKSLEEAILVTEGIARTAHEELSRYTPIRCMEEFVIPASRAVL